MAAHNSSLTKETKSLTHCGTQRSCPIKSRPNSTGNSSFLSKGAQLPTLTPNSAKTLAQTHQWWGSNILLCICKSFEVCWDYLSHFSVITLAENFEKSSWSYFIKHSCTKAYPCHSFPVTLHVDTGLQTGSRREWGQLHLTFTSPCPYFGCQIIDELRKGTLYFIGPAHFLSIQRHCMPSFILMWCVSIIRGPIKAVEGGGGLVHLSSVKGWAQG